MVRRHRDEQAAGGLGVAQEVRGYLVHPGVEGQVVFAEAAVGVAARRHQAHAGVLPGPGKDRHPAGKNGELRLGGLGHLQAVSQEAEAGDVGDRVHLQAFQGLGRGPVEGAITRMAAASASLEASRAFRAVAMMPVPRGLVSISRSPGRAPALV